MASLCSEYGLVSLTWKQTSTNNSETFFFYNGGDEGTFFGMSGKKNVFQGSYTNDTNDYFRNRQWPAVITKHIFQSQYWLLVAITALLNSRLCQLKIHQFLKVQ